MHLHEPHVPIVISYARRVLRSRDGILVLPVAGLRGGEGDAGGWHQTLCPRGTFEFASNLTVCEDVIREKRRNRRHPLVNPRGNTVIIEFLGAERGEMCFFFESVVR